MSWERLIEQKLKPNEQPQKILGWGDDTIFIITRVFQELNENGWDNYSITTVTRSTAGTCWAVMVHTQHPGGREGRRSLSSRPAWATE